MANLFSGLWEWFGFRSSRGSNLRHSISCEYDSQLKLAFKIYAIQLAINKLANALSLCDFQTLEQEKQTKSNLWYALNISPNQNQNASEFWQELVTNMVLQPEGALVIEYGDNYYNAEEYEVLEKALHPNLYRNVKVGEDFTFTEKTFKESDVLRLKLNNNRIKYVIDGVYKEFGKLIGNSITNYNRLNSKKVWVKLGTAFNQLEANEVPILDSDGKPAFNEDGTPKMTTEADLLLDEIFKDRLKNYFSESDSAVPIEDGIEIIEGNATSNGTGKNIIADTKDIRELFDDVINQVADAFGIPRGLMKGDIADIEGMTNNFITFAVNPLANLIEDEINRKLYNKTDILNETKCKVMTDLIKTYDPTKLASSAEALARIGALSTNEVRRWLKMERISEDWADKYIITKNYAPAEDRSDGDTEAKGGE